jgi:hypothetical protein
MKEYNCLKIQEDIEDTEEMLNDYAKEGWKLICSYGAFNGYLIMERELTKCSKCGK